MHWKSQYHFVFMCCTECGHRFAFPYWCSRPICSGCLERIAAEQDAQSRAAWQLRQDYLPHTYPLGQAR